MLKPPETLNSTTTVNGLTPNSDAFYLANQVKRMRTLMSGRSSVESLAEMGKIVEELAFSSPENLYNTRISLLIDIAIWYFYATQEPLSGMIPVEHAVAMAQRSGDMALRRKSLTIKGMICADTADIGKAVECFSQALDLAEQLNDPQAEIAVWNNLGVALMYSAVYQFAIKCFERAVALAEANPHISVTHSREAALTNIALCHLHLEEFEAGVIATERVLRDAPEPQRPEAYVARVLFEYTHTRLLLNLGNVDKARERALIAKLFANKAGMPRATVAAENAEGLVEVFTGQSDIGISRLTFSLERAKTLKAAYRDTLVALVMAHERSNQLETASEYQKDLIRHTSQVLQENALFHHRLHIKNLEPESHPDGQINLIQDRRYEILKRKMLERARVAERIEMLERLAVTAELRDDSTGEHSYRVGRLASILAKEYGLDDEQCYIIDLAGRLHDVGKIGIPDGILLKPGKLTPTERQLMETHTVIGAELLAKSDMPELQMAELIARHHHEHWNGRGYPFRMSAETIPLAARITALADVFDALTHVRPYKHAWTVEDSLAEIARLRGTQFDPHLTDLFIPLVHRLIAQHGDLDLYLGQSARQSRYLQSRNKLSFALHRPIEQMQMQIEQQNKPG